MDISVIIVNYNTLETTKRCLDSVFKLTRNVDFEVILVDNNSMDGSAEFFSKDSRVIFIESDKNLGFGKANNLGYRYSRGKYIFLLNSDTLLLNNALKEFYDIHETMPKNVACIGTMLKAEDGITENISYGSFPSLSETIKSLSNLYLRTGFCTKPKIDKDNSFKVDYVTGADLFIKRSVIEELGLFDPDFFMYFEETEMQFRYAAKGYFSMIVHGPTIIHLECVSSGGKRKKQNVNHKIMFFESMFLYMWKRYNVPLYMLFRLLAFFYLPTFKAANVLEFKETMKFFFKRINKRAI